MVKNELIKAISEKGNRSQKEVKEFLDLLDELIITALQTDGEVKLGLYSIKKEFKPERQGHNPSTGESMTIPAKNAVKVKVGKKLKDAVNQ